MTTPTMLSTWPTITVEAGLTPDAPVQAADRLVLNDAVKGLLNTGKLGSFIQWTDLSADVRSFSINRPSTRQQGPLWNWDAGTLTVKLDNSDGRYDPDNSSGPLFGGLDAMVPVRIRAGYGALAYPLYSGFADGWFPAEATFAGDYAELTLAATDAFKVLAGIKLPLVSITGVGALTGARVRDLLTRAGWYSSEEKRLIDAGDSTLQGTVLDDTVLSLMRIAVESELGQLYVNGSGGIVFRHRQALIEDARSNTVQAVFGDSPGSVHSAGTELGLAGIERAKDDTTIVNDIQAQRVGGTLQQIINVPSQATYLFPRSYSRTDLILQTDTDALRWAQLVSYIGKDSENRIESIRIDPQMDPLDLWPQVLGREIGDRIQVWRRPPGGASTITKDAFIAGISHECNVVDSTWTTVYTLQDATKYGNFLVLNNPTLGALNQNALSF